MPSIFVANCIFFRSQISQLGSTVYDGIDGYWWGHHSESFSIAKEEVLFPFLPDRRNTELSLVLQKVLRISSFNMVHMANM